ncbi:MAG: phosphorylase, partial [Bacteroidales bacterium]|nr:phosphorylase [Bacteroidales bacterium]
MIKKSELVLRAEDNTMYHLGIGPEHLADTILLVGDPGRVSIISTFFDKIDFQHQNRELVYHLGTYHGKQIAVLSTGMGVDNIDIIVNELDALANIDLKTGNPLPQHRTLQLIRIGTCGILQPDIPLLSFIA